MKLKKDKKEIKTRMSCKSGDEQKRSHWSCLTTVSMSDCVISKVSEVKEKNQHADHV